jgi:hypothetical protein
VSTVYRLILPGDLAEGHAVNGIPVVLTAAALLAAMPCSLTLADKHDGRVDELENRIRQYIAQTPGLTLTSITSVQCDETQCEIAFTGTDPNPRFVGQYSQFQENLWRQVAADGFVQFLTGGLSTREIAAGAKEYVMGFTYVAIDPPSTDPHETASQHAACAGAWLRRASDAQSKNFVETATSSREMAESEFALARPVLGADTDSIAELRALGPLLSECVPARTFVSH